MEEELGTEGRSLRQKATGFTVSLSKGLTSWSPSLRAGHWLIGGQVRARELFPLGPGSVCWPGKTGRHLCSFC